MEAERQQVRSEMNVSSSSEPAKVLLGGDLVYSKHPAIPKLWKEPPTRGIDGKILLVNTDKTLVPDLIVQEEEVFAEDEQVETTQSSTKRRAANMIGSGRLPHADSRLTENEDLPTPRTVLLINQSVLRGMAYSAFYAGEFSSSNGYLDNLHRRGDGAVDTYLLQLENFVYLRKPSAEIYPFLERFNRSAARLFADLAESSSIYTRAPMPEISLYHFLRWALELRHNNRLYAAIFVCCSLSVLPGLLTNRDRQFDLTYALFVEITLRIMNIAKPERGPVEEILITCLDSTFIMLLDRVQVMHPYAKASEWKKLVACSNAVAFLSNMTGEYEKAAHRVNWGLTAITRQLYPTTILYPDLKVNEAVLYLKTWRFDDAVTCYEEASKAYASCEGLDPHRREMIERADRALRRVKELRDANNEARESTKSKHERSIENDAL